MLSLLARVTRSALPVKKFYTYYESYEIFKSWA